MGLTISEHDTFQCMNPTTHAIETPYSSYTDQSSCEGAEGRWSNFSILGWADGVGGRTTVLIFGHNTAAAQIARDSSSSSTISFLSETSSIHEAVKDVSVKNATFVNADNTYCMDIAISINKVLIH